MPDDAPPFPYMRWARRCLDPADPLTLGLSGLPRPARADRAGPLARPPAGGGDPEGQLREALATRHGVAPEAVHLTSGASHGNFLVYLALARRGRVAVETPAYEAFGQLAGAVGAEAGTFRRDPDRGWRLDAADLARAARPGTRLLVVTDLHNPSGCRLHPEDLDLLVATARDLGAHVLVDEVYLDLDPLDRATAARLDPCVIVTSSLTKSHGLPDLRAGWIIGAPEVVAGIEAWDDLVCPKLPPRPMEDALAWLPHIPHHLAEVRARCARLTERVDAWVKGRDDVWWRKPDAGFTGFLRLGPPDRPIDGETFAARALETAGVRVVPGVFFQAGPWIRISYWRTDEALEKALDGLGRTLDSFGSRSAG